MARAAKLALAVLVLAALVAGPALAAVVVDAAWDKNSAQLGETVGYTYNGTGAAFYFVNISSPAGNYWETKVTGNGTGSKALSQSGMWTLTVYNSTTSDTSDCTVSAFTDIGSLITGFAENVVVAFVALVTAVVPLVVVIAIVGFAVVFIRRILDFVRLP